MVLQVIVCISDMICGLSDGVVGLANKRNV